MAGSAEATPKKKTTAKDDDVKIRLDKLDVILKDINEILIHYQNARNTTDHLNSTLQ